MTLEQQIHADLKALYAKVPAVENCKTGCTDCCGPVPLTLVEAAKAKTTPGVSMCLHCQLSLNGKCDIYDNRPLMCRLFAAVDTPEMTCPHGAKATKLLTKEESMTPTSEYLDTQEREKGLLPSEADELAALKRKRRAKSESGKA